MRLILECRKWEQAFVMVSVRFSRVCHVLVVNGPDADADVSLVMQSLQTVFL